MSNLSQTDTDAGPVGPSYEHTIGVVSLFFAALIGLGLQHVLEWRAPDGKQFDPHRWPCLILAVLLFLRFLIGSANYNWFEYIPHGSRASVRNVLYDLGALTLLGIVAIRICYSGSVEPFLEWSFAFLLIALASSLLSRWLPSQVGKWRSTWIFINATHVTFVALGWLLSPHNSLPLFGWTIHSFALLELSPVLWILAAVYLLLLIWDVVAQFKVLHERASSSGAHASATPPSSARASATSPSSTSTPTAPAPATQPAGTHPAEAAPDAAADGSDRSENEKDPEAPGGG